MSGMQYETADLRRMVVQLSRLVEISVTLNSTVDQESLLRFIALSASDVLEAETAVILLVAIVAAITLTMRRRSGQKLQDIARQVSVRASDRVRIVKMDAERRP